MQPFSMCTVLNFPVNSLTILPSTIYIIKRCFPSNHTLRVVISRDGPVQLIDQLANGPTYKGANEAEAIHRGTMHLPSFGLPRSFPHSRSLQISPDQYPLNLDITTTVIRDPSRCLSKYVCDIFFQIYQQNKNGKTYGNTIINKMLILNKHAMAYMAGVSSR